MDGDEHWEGDELERTPFLDPAQSAAAQPPEVPVSTAKRVWNRLFGLFVSVTIGCYAGFVCPTMQDAWIYTALFIGEALVCACVAGIIKTATFKRSITGFVIYFIISAVVTPIACWFGLQSTAGLG
jgi:hypothetical protein